MTSPSLIWLWSAASAAAAGHHRDRLQLPLGQGVGARFSGCTVMGWGSAWTADAWGSASGWPTVGSPPALEQPTAPVLVFDGGCWFCRRFAELSELRSGIPGLTIRDGRADHPLRRRLAQQGYLLRDGAVVLVGDQVLHGAEAIQWLCARMTPSAALLQLLIPLFTTPVRARRVYPLLLLARRLALAVRGLPLDPDPDRPWAPHPTPLARCRHDPDRSQPRRCG